MNNEIQDALLQFHRNQQQIDLLTANNTQLANYLLHMGLNAPQMAAPQITVPRMALLPAAPAFPPGGFQGVPDQTERPKRGRPRKVQIVALPALSEDPGSCPQWSPEARAKRAASFEARRKANKAPRWTPAQREEIGERTRKMWATKRKQVKQAAR